MSYLRVRIFYGIVLALALTMGVMLTQTLIQTTIERERLRSSSTEYKRVKECKAKSLYMPNLYCIRMFV